MKSFLKSLCSVSVFERSYFFKPGLVEFGILTCCITCVVVMLWRVHYGVDLTDESFWISDALGILHGNTPYVYNNFSYGTGAAFFLIPFVWIYEFFVPDHAGIVLFTRICYIIFYCVAVFEGYQVLKKNFTKYSVLLVSLFLLSYVGSNGVFNFNYKTTPCVLTFVSGLLIYDVVELKARMPKLKMLVSGFLMGMSCFAQPGYASALMLFGILLLIRTEGWSNKLTNSFCLCVGGTSVILIVFMPLILKNGFNSLVLGISEMIHPFPQLSLGALDVYSKLSKIMSIYRSYLFLLIPVFLMILVGTVYYVKRFNCFLSKRNIIIICFNCAICVLVIYCSIWQTQLDTANYNWRYGIVGSIGIIGVILLSVCRCNSIIFYMGLYPVIFTLLLIGVADGPEVLDRYIASVSALAIYFLVTLNSRYWLVVLLNAIAICVCSVAICINNFTYVYRDEHFSMLNTRVDSGVYKGIYTTPTRARDLPELEKYLNSIINENESYAFRDNVPAAYLMTYKGVMFDKTTWDCLNYTYRKGKASPSTLYAYYKRRGSLPHKVIYVDYGRDDQLSIQDGEYKYNEFINIYYRKIVDLSLNKTFYRVIVYEYTGKSNVNFDYWIEKHRYRVD